MFIWFFWCMCSTFYLFKFWLFQCNCLSRSSNFSMHIRALIYACLIFFGLWATICTCPISLVYAHFLGFSCLQVLNLNLCLFDFFCVCVVISMCLIFLVYVFDFLLWKVCMFHFFLGVCFFLWCNYMEVVNSNFCVSNFFFLVYVFHILM